MKTVNRRSTTSKRSETSYEAAGNHPPLPPLPRYGSHAGVSETSGQAPGNKVKQKKGTVEKLVTGGILATLLSILVSLSIYFRPFLSETVFPVIRTFYVSVADCVVSYAQKSREALAQALAAMAEAKARQAAQLETEEDVPYMDRSSQLGQISDMSAEPVYPPQEDAIYSCMLDTPLGPLMYYNQVDIRWKEYLYGGVDRLAKYGCGPVCVAMLINSFTPTSVSPMEMADWSADNGYFAPQGGSYHGLIPASLEAFGLQVESVTNRTPDHARALLNSDHVLVALMGKGSLTQNGHFIIIAQISPSGNVFIADPASYENSTKEWDLDLLMSELKKSYDSGGPLWAVSIPAEEGQKDR